MDMTGHLLYSRHFAGLRVELYCAERPHLTLQIRPISPFHGWGHRQESSSNSPVVSRPQAALLAFEIRAPSLCSFHYSHYTDLGTVDLRGRRFLC